MKIIVCIKSVLREAPEPGAGRPLLACELNAYDRPALALAVRLAGETAGTVTALSMGPPESAGDALLEALALGAHRAVLLSDPALAGADTLATSTALAAAIAKLAPYDLVLFGVRASDSDTGHVGPQTAQHLGLPLVAGAHSVAPAGPGLTLERRDDGYLEKYELDPPAALTVLPAAGADTDPPLAGIQQAYTKGTYTVWGPTCPVSLSEARTPKRTRS